MSDTLTEKLSKAAKPAVDYAKNKYQQGKTLYQQGKALMAPIDKGTLQTIQDKNAQVNQLKQQSQPQAQPNSYKKGGKVKKGGQAKVHKGERVLTKKQNTTFEKKGGFGKLYGK